MTKFSYEERRRILDEARANIERPVEPYTPPEEPVRYKTYEPRERMPPQRLDTAPARTVPTDSATDWSGWETWVSARINAALLEEREIMMTAALDMSVELMAQVVAAEREALDAIIKNEREEWGRKIADERAHWQREMSELRVEAAKLNSACDELHRMLNIERAKNVIDLPALPLSRRDVN
jgi:hypothetical protein